MSPGRLARIIGWLFDHRPLGDLRLRTRFIVLLTITVALFGLVNLALLERVAGRALTAEIEDHTRETARHIAVAAVRPLLEDDARALRALISGTTSADRDVGYVFIVSRERTVLVSSFGRTLPVGLLAANATRDGAEGSVVVSDRGAEYRDVAAPILRGELGEVRLGMRLDRVAIGLGMIRFTLGSMVLVFFVVALVGASATAQVISAPIERLTRAARTFDPAHPVAVFDFGRETRGEVGELVQGFHAMASRLQRLQADREAFQQRIVHVERLATVGALAAGIAHEVNNPLAGLRNCLQAIAREPEDLEQTREYALMMIDATRSIEQTVRSLRDVAERSRPQSGPVDLPRLAERVTLLLRHRADDAGVRLETDLPSRPPALSTDDGLLQQVLVNLLVNAIDASARGATVTLRVAAVSAGRVAFEVIDRGSGIAPEIRDRIFDPFVTTKADRGGTGLGLAMVRRLVTDLEGSVTVESTPGAGTSFTVTLPAGSLSGSPAPPVGDKVGS